MGTSLSKIGFFGLIYFVMFTFRNGLQYRNSDFKRLNRMNFSILCTILVTFGSQTAEFTLLKRAIFAIATSLGRLPNEYWDNHFHQYAYQTCKVGQGI